MLEVKDIAVYYGAIQAVKGVSLEIKEGEIVALIGSNGAGKSTTIMAITGIVRARKGSIIFDGIDITNMEPDKIVSLGVIQVPEGRRIFPNLTVKENLDLGAFLRKDKKEIKFDFEYIYSLFPILKNRAHQSAGTLSGGEQQMLAISRGLLAKPRILLLDEPSLGLAPILVNQIFDIIKKINKENGTTIFLVEQNANKALQIADKGYVMENGFIKIKDTASNLLKNEEVRRAYLGI